MYKSFKSRIKHKVIKLIPFFHGVSNCSGVLCMWDQFFDEVSDSLRSHGQAPLSTGFSQARIQECFPMPSSGVFYSLGIFSDLSPAFPILQMDSLLAEPSGKTAVFYIATSYYMTSNTDISSVLSEHRRPQTSLA